MTSQGTLLQRFTRIENQLEALRRAEMVLCEEILSLAHSGQVTERSAQRIMGQLESLKTLKPR